MSNAHAAAATPGDEQAPHTDALPPCALANSAGMPLMP